MPPCSCYSPAPAPSTEDYVFSVAVVDELRQLVILCSVVTTVLLLFFLFFLGRIRRSVRWRYSVRYLTKISYLLLPISITYIIGVLHEDSKPDLLYPVWAAILVYAYGGVVTITACDLRDNEETLHYVMRTVPLFFWTLWLGFLVFDMTKYDAMVALLITVVCFLGLALVNTRQTIAAFYKASKSKGLPQEVKPLVRYTDRSMSAFKYMVWGNDQEDGTTIEEIWKWVTTDEEEADEGDWEPILLAKKRRFLAKCGGKDELRDMCLSYALFRMLLIRFAGFPPISNAWCLNQEGILDQEEPERVFRIIEVELDFLFDYFYTKSHVSGSYRFRDILIKLAQILSIGFVTAFGIPVIVRDSRKNQAVDKVSEFVVIMKVILTWASLSLIMLLESCKYIMVHFSRRKIVWLLCTGIRESASSCKWAHTTQRRIVLIWTIRRRLTPKFDVPFLSFFLPWQKKLGQYSFLESYGRVPILAHKPFSLLSRLVKLPRKGQRGEKVVPLSKQVKQAIFSSLKRNHDVIHSQGTDTVRQHHVQSTSQLERNDTRFILVWHIATSFYESLHPIEDHQDPEYENFLVANQLSKYCAYLVAFAPELLPYHVYTTERDFDEAVKQAIGLDIKRLNNKERYQRLISTTIGGVSEDNIVARGALLAQEFMTENTNRGWGVLAQFWAELLLCLAKSDNTAVHGEYLVRGGEFITHLWVLLTHAEVLTTNSSSSPI